MHHGMMLLLHLRKQGKKTIIEDVRKKYVSTEDEQKVPAIEGTQDQTKEEEEDTDKPDIN